jgi:Flp pilus assembly protein TadG
MESSFFSRCIDRAFHGKRVSHENRKRGGWFARAIGPDAGGSLIEFALVLPMMMVLITGMASFGIALNNNLVLTDAVGAGSRALALARGQTLPAIAASDPCAFAAQTVQQSAPTLRSGSFTYSVTVTLITSSGTSTTTYPTTTTTGCPGLVLQAPSGTTTERVQVNATYPFSLMVYAWAPQNLTMSATTTSLVQ